MAKQPKLPPKGTYAVRTAKAGTYIGTASDGIKIKAPPRTRSFTTVQLAKAIKQVRASK